MTSAEERAYLRGLKTARRALARKIKAGATRELLRDLKPLDALQAHLLAISSTQRLLLERLDEIIGEAAVLGVLPDSARPSRFLSVHKTSAVGKTTAAVPLVCALPPRLEDLPDGTPVHVVQGGELLETTTVGQLRSRSARLGAAMRDPYPSDPDELPALFQRRRWELTI